MVWLDVLVGIVGFIVCVDEIFGAFVGVFGWLWWV